MKRLLAHLFGFLLTLQVVLGVTLEWDPSPDAWVSGYALHYGTASSNYTIRIDVGNATSCTITNLTPGVTYYFVATAYATDGQESLPSNEVAYTVPGGNPSDIIHLTVLDIPPPPVGWVSLVLDPLLTDWVSGYAIHYGTTSSNYTTRIDLGRATTCTLTNLTPGVTYYFAATAYTESGQENFPSEELRYTVPVLYETNRPAATTNVWMRP